MVTTQAICGGRLENKVAIITGASKGIGSGIAKVFASEGADVVLVSRTENDLKKVMDEITKSGGKASYMVADITKPEDMERMAQATLKDHGRIDILIHNAAGIYPPARIDTMTNEEWHEEIFPKIAAKAKKEKAEIHWGDEAGFRSDHQTGTSYSPKGQTPIIKSTSKRFKTNMISTITNRGTLRFMMFDGNFTADVFIDFLRRLIWKSKVKIFLILDNHRVHHAYKVKDWVKAHKDKIELFFLPPNSPELNPDELLNQDVKSNAVGRKRAKTLTELKNNITRYLFGTQKSPDIIKSYFRKSEVLYAA